MDYLSFSFAEIILYFCFCFNASAESVRCVAIVVLVLCVNFEFTSAEEWEDFICFGHPTDTIIAHPTECNLFFECDGGVGSQNQCPPNSFFNPEINECDPNYQCNLPGSTTTTSYPYITTPMKPTKPTKPTNASNHTIKCPTNDTTMVTFLANPNNCSEYFMCYYGKPLRFVCPRRYEFSAADKACIPAKQSTCNVSYLCQCMPYSNGF